MRINALRGHGFWNIDLALSKSLALTERVRLQIRGDLLPSTIRVFPRSIPISGPVALVSSHPPEALASSSSTPDSVSE